MAALAVAAMVVSSVQAQEQQQNRQGQGQMRSQEIAWASSLQMCLTACQMQLYSQSLPQSAKTGQAGAENAQNWQTQFQQGQQLFSQYGRQLSNRQFNTVASNYTKSLQSISFSQQRNEPQQAGTETSRENYRALQINGYVQQSLSAYSLISSGQATQEARQTSQQVIQRSAQEIKEIVEEPQVSQSISSMGRNAQEVVAQIQQYVQSQVQQDR